MALVEGDDRAPWQRIGLRGLEARRGDPYLHEGRVVESRANIARQPCGRGTLLEHPDERCHRRSSERYGPRLLHDWRLWYGRKFLLISNLRATGDGIW